MRTFLLPCQACGGTLEVPDNVTIIKCDYCGQLNGVEMTEGQVSLTLNRTVDILSKNLLLPHWRKQAKDLEVASLAQRTRLEDARSAVGSTQDSVMIAKAKLGLRRVFSILAIAVGIGIAIYIEVALSDWRVSHGDHYPWNWDQTKEMTWVIGSIALALVGIGSLVIPPSKKGVENAEREFLKADEQVDIEDKKYQDAKDRLHAIKDKIAQAEAEVRSWTKEIE